MSLFGFVLLSRFLASLEILHSLSLSFWFSIISLLLHFSFKFHGLNFHFCCSFACFLSIIFIHYFLTILVSPIQVCLILFFGLLLKEFLDSCLFQFLSIKSFLNFELVDFHFSISPFPFFASEFIIVLGFFDLVHGSSIRKVLNLSRRNASLFFLSLYGILDTNAFLNSQFSHVFVELVNTLCLF